MKTVTVFESFDGKTFPTSEECKAYEAENVFRRIAGLTVEQINAAIAGKDTDLRDALEAVGSRCATARREAGEYRRAPKGRAATPSKAPAPAPEAAAADDAGDQDPDVGEDL